DLHELGVADIRVNRACREVARLDVVRVDRLATMAKRHLDLISTEDSGDDRLNLAVQKVQFIMLLSRERARGEVAFFSHYLPESLKLFQRLPIVHRSGSDLQAAHAISQSRWAPRPPPRMARPAGGCWPAQARGGGASDCSALCRAAPHR